MKKSKLFAPLSIFFLIMALVWHVLYTIGSVGISLELYTPVLIILFVIGLTFTFATAQSKTGSLAKSLIGTLFIGIVCAVIGYISIFVIGFMNI